MGRVLILVPEMEKGLSSGVNYVSVHLHRADLPGDPEGKLAELSEPPVSLLEFVGEASTRKLQIIPSDKPDAWNVAYFMSEGTGPTYMSWWPVQESPPWATTLQPDFSDEGLNSLLVRKEPPDEAFPRLHLVERSDGWNIYLVDQVPVEHPTITDLLMLRRDFKVATVPMDDNPNHERRQ